MEIDGHLVAITVAVLVAGVVALAMLYSPGLPKYTITPGSLTIQDRFYPVTLSADFVDEHGIRIVDLDVDREWRPTLRTNGFANGHYASGWFKVANGNTVRMYRAGGKRLVLLPPKGDGVPVLLQVENPETFIDNLRRIWSHRV